MVGGAKHVICTWTNFVKCGNIATKSVQARHTHCDTHADTSFTIRICGLRVFIVILHRTPRVVCGLLFDQLLLYVFSCPEIWIAAWYCYATTGCTMCICGRWHVSNPLLPHMGVLRGSPTHQVLYDQLLVCDVFGAAIWNGAWYWCVWLACKR